MNKCNRSPPPGNTAISFPLNFFYALYMHICIVPCKDSHDVFYSGMDIDVDDIDLQGVNNQQCDYMTVCLFRDHLQYVAE